jgi:transcriptional regulator with XRE-family HTH domain
MKRSSDTSNMELPSDFAVEMMKDEKDGEAFALEYFKASFLSSVGRSLYYTRRQAGLTQEQVAERMNTTQSAVARFEADKNGSMSFRRFVDFAIACDVMPRSLVLHPILEPITALRNEVIALADAQQVQEPFNVGFSFRSDFQAISCAVLMQHWNDAMSPTTPITVSTLASSQGSSPTVSSAEALVKEQCQKQPGLALVQSRIESITSATSAQTVSSHRGQEVAA